MIEDQDITMQRPMPMQDAESSADNSQRATTLQIAAAPSVKSAPAAPGLPAVKGEDLLALRIASDPQLSPDDAWIAFTLLNNDEADDTTHSAIWLVSSSGEKTRPPQQITHGEHHDYAPRWSPDGSTLAFLSDRNGTAQIYLLSMSGGEAKQFSQLVRGVSEYHWRPDGQAIVAHSPWKADDDQKSKGVSSPVAVYARLGSFKDGKGYTDACHTQLWLLPREGTPQRLTAEAVDLEQSCWSPDGTEIVFCANRRTDADLSTTKALWVLNVTTGQMRRLTPEEGIAQMPSWSPDGQFIAYLFTPDQTRTANISPWIVAAQGETTPQPVVQQAEQFTCQAWIIDELRTEWLHPPQWYPESTTLLVPVQEHGQVHLYQMNRAQNTATRLTQGNGRYLSPHLSANGKTIVFVRADWFTPGDIWHMNGDGTQLRKLSRINDSFLQSHHLFRPRRIAWQNDSGQEIEGWLYLPTLTEGQKAPLIVMPHGGPTLAWGDAYVHEFQVVAAHGYAVLAPNPRGSAGYGEDFAHAAHNDWGGADFQDLMAGIEHILATEPIDAQRLGIGGMSYGGYMTLWAITQSQRFKAAVCRNGISHIPSAALLSDQPLWFSLFMPDETRQAERSPLTHVEAIKTPLLLLHAQEDLNCPFSEAMQMFVALRKRRQVVELIAYPQASHLMDWPQVGSPRQRVDRLRRTLAWYEHFI